MAHRMAKHSFSMVLYLVSLFESFRLRYSTGRSSPPTTWARTAPSPIRRVHLQQKGDATQGSLYLGYGLLAQLRPLDRIGCFLFSEISQRAGKLRIIRNKPSIISRQPQELSHLLFGLGTWANNRGLSHLSQFLASSFTNLRTIDFNVRLNHSTKPSVCR